jgi:hypothetical protein
LDDPYEEPGRLLNNLDQVFLHLINSSFKSYARLEQVNIKVCNIQLSDDFLHCQILSPSDVKTHPAKGPSDPRIEQNNSRLSISGYCSRCTQTRLVYPIAIPTASPKTIA